jgi:hypothetical protein
MAAPRILQILYFVFTFFHAVILRISPSLFSSDDFKIQMKLMKMLFGWIKSRGLKFSPRCDYGLINMD